MLEYSYTWRFPKMGNPKTLEYLRVPLFRETPAHIYEYYVCVCMLQKVTGNLTFFEQNNS